MERRVAVRRVGLVVLLANLLLVSAKGAAWAATGSLAVGSEAVNSLSDVLYSVVVLAGLYVTTRPPDLDHPHGHERIEPFVSLSVAVGVVAAGLGILWQAVAAVVSGDVAPATASPLAVAVLVASAAVKFGLYRYVRVAGERHNSPALVATALDNRNDILTAGAALAGVVGAALGYPVLDPVAAAIVSLGVIYAGYEIGAPNVGYLVGRAPPDDLRAAILDRALDHPEVRGAHDVVAHFVGPEVDVSLHVEVEGDLTLARAHEVETEIVESIGGMDRVDDVFVHVDPRELGEWKSGPDGDGRDGEGTGGGDDPATVADDPA